MAFFLRTPIASKMPSRYCAPAEKDGCQTLITFSIANRCRCIGYADAKSRYDVDELKNRGNPAFQQSILPDGGINPLIRSSSAQLVAFVWPFDSLERSVGNGE
jgi:hypothetical protein